MKLTDEFIKEVLQEAAVEIYGDDEINFEDEVRTFAEWSGENGDLVAETIGYAVKIAAERLGYPQANPLLLANPAISP
jgi:hypothetical protein